MKRVISLVFFVLFSLQLFADSRQQPINIERKGGPRDGLTMYQAPCIKTYHRHIIAMMISPSGLSSMGAGLLLTMTWRFHRQ